MNHTIDRTLPGVSFPEADRRVRRALLAEGFGVKTEIDVEGPPRKQIPGPSERFHNSAGADPAMAFRVLQTVPRTGTPLPCNVVLREIEGGVEVITVDPVVSMTAIDDVDRFDAASGVRLKLEKAVSTA